MTDTALRLKDELLRLSEEDRRALAHLLWDSVGEEPESDLEVDADFLDELKRRSRDVEEGRASEQPFREAIDELRRDVL